LAIADAYRAFETRVRGKRLACAFASMSLRAVICTVAWCGAAAVLHAQDPHAGHDSAAAAITEHQPSSARWKFTADANVFVGHNTQVRQFADYAAWESQNWVMGAATHGARGGRIIFTGMASLEPLTIDPQGSPQLFQTGESYRGVPLVNLQHPHDALMALGVTYRIVRSERTTLTFGADLVGSPTLGPTAFMHRESARSNPQVPLTHHFLDSTHITPGVVRAGITAGAWTVEGSGFRGAEPDDNRWNVEQPAIDSWAARLAWQRGPWHAQFSGGHLHQPEWFEPFDATRLTASIDFNGTVHAHPLAMTLAWGENRQFNGFNGTSDGFLLEGNLAATRRSTIYARAEEAAKELFGVGPHPRAFSHRHWMSEVIAVTGGYLFDPYRGRYGRLGIGVDATFYRMQPDTAAYYGSSHAFHVFLRWRPDAPGGPVHSHVH
jgi:hypothetical protein